MGNELFNYDGTSSQSTNAPLRVRDISGRKKVTMLQNIYEADFEYGLQPLRWEVLTVGGGSVLAVPNQGGVQMSVTSASGDVVVRQSRPYHRYQPGKMMYAASGFNFGPLNANQVQRFGFYDDSNGIYFEQGLTNDPVNNPYGMFACIRSDIGGTVTVNRIPLNNWSCGATFANSINWQNIQMLYLEYGWYGAGQLRWGILINGEPIILHSFAAGNVMQVPWARTGN